MKHGGDVIVSISLISITFNFNPHVVINMNMFWNRFNSSFSVTTGRSEMKV